MNFLGHTHVALAAGRDDAEYLLGAVLPDLAPMAGVRLADRSELTGPLGDGVACHLRADAAFHAHPAFRAGSGALRRALTDRGVASGPARAVGHAGWELLLDGTLVATATEAAFRRALAGGERARAALGPADGDRWRAFLDRGRAAAGLHYDDPTWVADRLHAMLARRPRLALPDSQVAVVAEVLGTHAAAVRSVAGAVLADTAREAGSGPALGNMTGDGLASSADDP
jgi:hypothetical protein